HVIVTSAGSLTASHGVQLIFLAAAMHGEPTKGFQLIRNYPICVSNALGEIDRLNGGLFSGIWLNPYRNRLRSIVFPLFGTRDHTRDPQEVAFRLILAATNYLRDHPESSIEVVYFLAFTDVDRDLYETAFRRCEWSVAEATVASGNG